MTTAALAPLGWLGIVRLGLVQSALGSIVMLTTSTLNRVMVVEYGLAVMIPAGLVAWHYAVQLSRPRWGYGSDLGHRRTPWIIVGMGVLALGAILATDATFLMASSPTTGLLLAILAFTMIGGGVGAAGTSLLALLATRVAPSRRPAAAATTWIMMILGIVATAGIVGSLLDPFSPARLASVAGGVAIVAFLVALAAVWRVEGEQPRTPPPTEYPWHETRTPFRLALREIWDEPKARRFTIFVFVSMLAYSAQDLILEPFAGLVFGYTPGQSTTMAGIQHAGVLAGMVLVGVGGSAFAGGSGAAMRNWTIAGCVGSALALGGLAMAALVGPGWPLRQTVFLLGFANGMFAVAAIGSMMALAGKGRQSREGTRMGLWGAAQAIAFGLGGFLGAAGVDAGRRLFDTTSSAFLLVFAVEATLFLLAAILAFRVGAVARAPAEQDFNTPLVAGRSS
jgi:BCD family chlorophyll transporter-like MFS transporter